MNLVRHLLRSTALRIALIFASALLATTALVFVLVYWRFYDSNVALVRQVLQDEVAKVLTAPGDQLRARLDLRLTQDLRHLDYVGLYDAQGARIFGNAPAHLPVPVDGLAHLVRTDAPLPEAQQSEEAIVVARRRPDGHVLLLGRSLVYVDQLADAMVRAFIAALGPVVLIAFVVATVVSLRALRRLAPIQGAIRRVMSGELSVRLPERGSHDDIDEIVRAVNRMLDEIGRLVGQIRSVGDNIAHDLRSPLAIMRARLERGLADGSDATLRRLTAEALRDLDHAMATVTALLRISELESGGRRRAFAQVDLRTICLDTVELFGALGEAKGVEVVVEAPSPAFVAGDRDLLREAVANLVDNAIKFTPPGGTVAVECSAAPDPTILIRDTGPGIAQDERDKVFRRFYRAQDARGSDGLGIGLSMAATIVDLHHFTLRILDAPVGTVFEIATAAPDRAVLPAQIAASDGGRS